MSGPAVLLRRALLEDRLCDVLLVGGRIECITDSSIGGYADLTGRGPADVVDVRGAVLLPGLTDEHVHLAQWAAARRRIDVSEANSAEHAAALVVTAVAGTPVDPGAVVVGHGFRHATWGEPPSAQVLDAALPGRAVVLVSSDLHTAWCSSTASHVLGLDTVSGVVREDEAMAVIARAGWVEPAVMDSWVLDAVRVAAARGVTSVVDFEYADTVADWSRRSAGAAGGPAVRVRAAIWTDRFEAALAAGLRSGDPLPGVDDPLAADRLRVGPLKVFVDGSLGTGTAFCDEPYPGREGPEAHGLLCTPPPELEWLLHRAAAAGLDVAVHAIGDRATSLALDAFEAVGCGGRIEHAQQVREADLPRFAALGVMASVQPRHAPDDRDAADRLWSGAGGRTFPYGALVRAGAEVVLGSDAPVAPLDPWDAVASAVHRSVDGRPPWHPEQHLTLAQAMAAASSGRHGVAAGDVADLTLVAEAPAAAWRRNGVDGLRAMEVLGTLVGGRWTHRAHDLA